MIKSAQIKRAAKTQYMDNALLSNFGLKLVRAGEVGWAEAIWYLEYDQISRSFSFCVKGLSCNKPELDVLVPLCDWPRKLNHLDRLVFI